MSAPVDDAPADDVPADTTSDDDASVGGHPPTVARSSNTFLGDAWVNAKRWTRKALRNPFVIVGSIVQPVIFLFLFLEVFGGVAGQAVSAQLGEVAYETYLLPAIAIQVALASAVSSGIGLVNDIENGMFEKVLVSPMNRTAVFAGKTASEVARIAAQIVIILALGVLLGARIETGVVGALAVVGVGVIFSLWYIAFSNTLAVLTRDQESTIILANLLQFPLLFLSSAFLPLSAMPGWIQTFARFNPVTYGVDAARSLVLGEDVMTVLEVSWFGGMLDGVVPGVVVLLALAAALGAVTVVLLSRATSSEVR